MGKQKSSSKLVTIDDILNLDQFSPQNANVYLSSQNINSIFIE